MFNCRYPSSKLAIIGSSAGSGLAASYCGQYGENTLADVVVAISPGYKAQEMFTNPQFSQIYEQLLVLNLKKNIINPNMDCLSAIVDPVRIKNARTLRDIDEHLYAKVNGYESLSDYWYHNDPDRCWGKFSVPILCISSLDDPVCLPCNIPFELFRTHPNTMLITTEKGGHCGFLEGLRCTPWADKLALDYIQTVIQYLNQEKFVNSM